MSIFDFDSALQNIFGERKNSVNGLVDMHKLDSNFEEAARLVVSNQRCSISDLQRRLGMGHPRAAKVMDQLEAAGIVGPQKPRQVLAKDVVELNRLVDLFLEQQRKCDGLYEILGLDSNFKEAARFVVSNQSGSASDLQNHFEIESGRAESILDQLEAAGIVGPQKPRQILVADFAELNRILDSF